MKKLCLIGVGLAFVWSLIAAPLVVALSAEGYSSASNIKTGVTVSLTDSTSTENRAVEPAGISNADRFVGVTVDPTATNVTTTDNNSDVYVATRGELPAMVSDLNGEVKKGDYLVLSPLKGVFMKAGQDNAQALAVALTDVGETSTESVQSNDNPNFEVQVGTILVDLNAKTIPAGEQSDSFLILFGSSLTGKDVSAVQVIVAFVIFFLLLIVEGSIIYGSIYSSITALGRNPLSKGAVYKELAQVTILALVILGAGLGAIYLVLWA